MTMFSVLAVSSAAVALLSSPVAAKNGVTLGFDMISNGRYWWGGTWQHRPNGGNTNDCVCMKGYNADKGWKEGYCLGGLDFNDHIEEQFVGLPFDHNQPIDITIHGSDGLWIDRFQLSTHDAGIKYYGAQNTIGYCLSTDRNSYFDQYSEHHGCKQTLTLYPNGNVYGRSGRAGYHREQWLLDRTANTCQQLFGRRRMSSGMLQAPSQDEDVTPLTEEDRDPAGPNPTHVPGGTTEKIVEALHMAIRHLVKLNAQVTDAQIDSVLNSAMLTVEHLNPEIAISLPAALSAEHLIPEIEQTETVQEVNDGMAMIPEMESTGGGMNAPTRRLVGA